MIAQNRTRLIDGYVPIKKYMKITDVPYRSVRFGLLKQIEVSPKKAKVLLSRVRGGVPNTLSFYLRLSLFPEVLRRYASSLIFISESELIFRVERLASGISVHTP